MSYPLVMSLSITLRVQYINSSRVEHRRMLRCNWLVRTLYMDDALMNDDGCGYCTRFMVLSGGCSHLSYIVCSSSVGCLRLW